MADKENTENPEVEEAQESKEEVKSKKKSKRGSRGGSSKKQDEKIAGLESELQEQKDKFLRLYAEFDNFRKRTAKERLELFKTAGADVIKDLLPVLDDMERSRKAAESDESAEPLSEGVIMVFDRIQRVLKQKGLEEMESTGMDFDPELHEALTEIPAPSEDMKGKIVDTIEKGYTINEKIIRHARVVVGK